MYREEAPLIVEIDTLVKEYPLHPHGRGIFAFHNKRMTALDQLSLGIRQGEILGLVGGSGSGKSTLAEILLQLQKPTSGEIRFKGERLATYAKAYRKQFRREAQMIFQDPYATLNPRQTIFQTVAEPLLIQGIKHKDELLSRVKLALERAELKPTAAYLSRYPHQLSGGQRQRLAIARAIVVEPIFLVADEPVSMLDVSIRAGILNVLKSLNQELNVTILYISHDLSTIYYLCDRIAVLREGSLVEVGKAEEVIHAPQHAYTQALLAAIPRLSVEW